MTRELTERERQAKIEAWQNHHLGDDEMVINDRRGFSAGFEAGLEYQQAEIDRLREVVISLINYRDKAGALNFQLEKADDWINQLRNIITQAENPQ